MRLAADALLGRCCVLCGGSDADAGLCPGCRGDLPRDPWPCPRCAAPLPVRLPPGLECPRCLLQPPPFGAARAALRYAFPVDAALKAFKFDGRLQYAPVFAGLMAAELRAHFPRADALVPVPLHRWRHAVRGFNQALELARPLARASGLPLVTRTRRIRRTVPQAGLSAAERRRNVRRAFAVAGPLRCRRPVIVDDVMTTGETCAQLARALLAAGADEVAVLTAARAG